MAVLWHAVLACPEWHSALLCCDAMNLACVLCCVCVRFCNVHYVITLLRDLLVGLDVAQRVLGFTHYDLK